MKTIIKISILLTIFTILFSCSNSSNNTPNNNPQNFTFEINQTIANITELDDVVFSITNPNNATIYNITWYVNNVQITSANSSYTLPKTFTDFGTFNIKVKIDYNSSYSSTIEKNVVVAERPKNLVTINKIEILSYQGAYQFDTTYNGYYLKTKFDITELDENNTSVLKYISTENSQNWGQSSTMIYPISWDMSSANYKVKVYQNGNYYPNNQANYNTLITFYGAGTSGANQLPYNPINVLKLDLNPYRSLQPNLINISNNGMQFRLTVQWN